MEEEAPPSPRLQLQRSNSNMSTMSSRQLVATNGFHIVSPSRTDLFPLAAPLPAKQYHTSSPKSLFHKRYRINEPINAETKYVYGIDQMSKMPKCQKVVINVYHSEEAFKRHVRMYQMLRSRFVANLLDSWFGTEGFGCIVLERGTIRLDEYIQQLEGEIEFEAKKEILLDLATTWLFLNEYNFYCEFKPNHFMHYAQQWRLVELEGVCHNSELDSPDPNPLYVEPGIAFAIIAGDHSQLAHNPSIPVQTLGMILLELFVMSPLFADKTYDELHALLQSQAFDQYLETPDDLEILALLKAVILQPTLAKAELTDYLTRVASLLKTWNAPTEKIASPVSKTAGYLPSIV
eukprot:GILK01010743.1.p1 GENE.GILK01010743.1~~GILK01010743.1.p1  ORF type:complete len:364 (-),score=31.95 GILK01010743.1:31-1074(-)